jgi:hypothetical protein
MKELIESLKKEIAERDERRSKSKYLSDFEHEFYKTIKCLEKEEYMTEDEHFEELLEY